MPFIEQISIKNYKLLQNVTLSDLQPINVVLGPNGTGKSTLFDVFGFLADCLQSNVKKALESRGRFNVVRSRNADGPISFTIKYRESDYLNRLNSTPITYHLSRTGDNLANVVQYLSEEHPDTFEQILTRVVERIPGLETIKSERTLDGRLVLQFKDGPFQDPFLARNVSDGTLKMFAYLILLYDPTPPPLLCIEEPENGLHPKLLNILAEEFRAHARGGMDEQGTQVFVSSHSPYFIDALKPEELWIMDRNEKGYASIVRADKINHIPEFVSEGASLGSLWYEGYFGRGNG